MKKILSVALITGMGLLYSCGGGTNDADNAKARQDSIDAAARAQAVQDSIDAANAAPKDIITTATAAGNFSTLMSAIESAGLTSTLQGTGPFTVFAPTDAAFSSLPKGALDKLMMPDQKDALVKVLLYHVISGQLMAANVTGQKELTMMNGLVAKVTTKNGMPAIEKGAITTADLVCSNGVIHVIDAVNMPAKDAKKGKPSKASDTSKPTEGTKDKDNTTIDVTKPKGSNSNNTIDVTKPKGNNSNNTIDVTKPKGQK